MDRNVINVSIVLSAFIVFVLALVQHQLYNGSINFQRAILNTYSKEIISPKRGEIVDASGIQLAHDVDIYDVWVDASVVSRQNFILLYESLAREDLLSSSLPEISKDSLEVENLMTLEGRRSAYLLLDRVTKEQYDLFFKKYGEFKGLIGIRDWRREYGNPEEFSSVLGYVGRLDENDIREGQGEMGIGQVGKSGLEKFYNKFLTGDYGEAIVYRMGTGEVRDMVIKSQKDGGKLELTLDSEWQMLLYRLLDNQVKKSNANSAAGIIVDSDTGEIKSMVSVPGYDLNAFVGGISSEAYAELLSNPSRPLINKVVSVRVAPGSTIKPLVALFALNDRVVELDYSYVSNGCEQLGDGITFCEADRQSLGVVDFDKSIYRSSNLFYCSLGKLYDQINDSRGIQYFLANFDKIGGVQKTSVDLPEEVGSVLPSPERTQKIYSRDWSTGDMCNTFIGQGDMALTPVKMVTLVSMLENRGKIFRPYLVKRILNSENRVVFENATQQMYSYEVTDAGYFDRIEGAMRQTVEMSNGSASLLKGLQSGLSIKTGSADAVEDLGEGRILKGAHSWVVGSFEYGGETYSFVLVQYFGGRGFQTLPVIGNFINCIEKELESGCEVY